MQVEVPVEERLAEEFESRAEFYRRLADIFHHLLSEQSLESLLERVANTLIDIVPYASLTIYQADDAEKVLTPVLARDPYAEEILNHRTYFGKGITGWAAEQRQPVLANDALNDPRSVNIPGTPMDPESLISVPLIARDKVKGALNLYRQGEGVHFSELEFELAKRFGDAAALALDNAQSRAALEHQAQTDSLTGLYNHRFFQERLRSELTRATRSHDSVALMMFDIDDFKKINDVYGHSVGDNVLVGLAEIVKSAVRGSDVVCRIGGEEFAVIMPSCDAGDAMGLASRLAEGVSAREFECAGIITLSTGIAQGPAHASNPRELVACADAAMLTAKAKGKNRIVLFDDESALTPESGSSSRRDVRSIAHLKMLQSVAGKLNRLNDVRQIGDTIANELRALIDYHSCMIYIQEEDLLVPIAIRGELADYAESDSHGLVRKTGVGVVGHVAQSGKSLLIGNSLESEEAVQLPGTPVVEESAVAVPMTFGTKVVGVVMISSYGVDQFDEDDIRLLEVLAGHASVALENARLYEAQRREAENAKALLEVADVMSQAPDFYAVCDETVRAAAELLEAEQTSLWLYDPRSDEFHCFSHFGYVGDVTAEPLVRQSVAVDLAFQFINGHREPFELTPTGKEEWLKRARGAKSRTVAIAPLPEGDGVKGWITVRQPVGRNHHFTDERMRLLAGLSYQASVALQKALLYKSQKESAEVANALLDFGRQLATAEELDDVLKRTTELGARILGSPKITVWLQDMVSGDIVAEALWGFEDFERAKFLNARFPEEVAKRFLGGDEPFSVRPGDFKWKDELTELFKNSLLAVVPLKLEGGRLGCIVAEAPARGDYEFSERKMRLLAGIAHQVKLAIDNACSFENLERTFLSTVEALANALEAKDEYTSSHARSITDMALEVGSALGMDLLALKRLELGALFHDIGKIGIPSEILLKPGPLTEREREIMNTHPELGERILAPIERLEEVRPIVRHCHEHWDGSGYPDGRRSEEIPLESRVILVCDAFHAMTTDRPYRKRLSDEEAFRRLRESSGRQFDPKVVEVFLTLMKAEPALASVG